MKFLKFIAVFALFLTIFIYQLLPEYFRYIIVLPIIQYFSLIVNSKENKPLVTLFIYAIIFNLYLIPKFLFDIDIVVYDNYDTIEFYNKALLLNIIFICTFMFFFKPVKKDFIFPDYQEFFRPNTIIVLVNILIMLIIFFFGFSGQSILDNARYGTEGFGDKTIFTEYYIIFLAIALFHSRKRGMKYLIFTLAIIMAFKSIIYGSRISALLIFLTIFILEFANKFSLKKIISVAFLGILFMNFLGMFRSGMINTDLTALLRVTPGSIMTSTQSNMFYGSVSFIGLVEDNIFDFSVRMKSLFGFILRIFLPTELSFEEGSLASFAQKSVPMGGGAHPVTYFYIWFSYAGPVIFGLFLAKAFNQFHHHQISKYFYFFIFIILSTMPRWFGYEPGIIFKMWWVGSIIIIFLTNMFFKKKKIIDSNN